MAPRSASDPPAMSAYCYHLQAAKRLTLVLRDRLDRRLHRETDAPDAEPTNELDDRQVALRRTRVAVANHEAESEDLDAEAEDDDGLEDADVADDDAHHGCGERAGEGGDRGNARRGEGGLVAGDEEVGVAAERRFVSYG